VFKHLQFRALVWALMPRYVQRRYLVYLRWEAGENLREWLDTTPAKIVELRSYVTALDTDIRLLDIGIRGDYQARRPFQLKDTP
jgi:hypothetical protein